MLKISRESRHGVRALLDIAYHSGGNSTSSRLIAERQGIPPRYIDHIFQKLKGADLVRSVRGPAGGYYLARKPEEIRVGDVIRATEGSIKLVFCVAPEGKGKKTCERMEQCVARPVWKEAAGLVMEFFDSITLADLCARARVKGIERDMENGLTCH